MALTDEEMRDNVVRLAFGGRPDRFEAFCYSSRAREDEMSGRLRSAADHWRQVERLDDVRLAAMVRNDGVDILVDLAGHTWGHRLLAFARKPAPVQASWIGYIDTTGLSSIDYLVINFSHQPCGSDCQCCILTLNIAF